MHKSGNPNSCKGGGGGLNNTDMSPFNSKFTVLRFSQQKSASSNGGVRSQGNASLRPFELSPETTGFDVPVATENTQMLSVVS